MLEHLTSQQRDEARRRFLNRVKRRTSGCWIWMGAKTDKGYGVVGIPMTRRLTKSHRLAFEFERGPFDPSLCVLHRCDIPSCVNPDHLFLGTRADNNEDMHRKGRARPGGSRVGIATAKYRRGERHQNAILDEARVRQIRTLSEGGSSLSEIARRFGVGL